MDLSGRTRNVADMTHGKIYAYLPSANFVANWTDGGVVPISAARKYWSVERRENLTLDECYTQRGAGLSGNQADEVAEVFIGPIPLITAPKLISRCEGETGPFWMSRSEWSGLVFCFSKSFTLRIAKKLGKRVACVEIANPQILFDAISEQIGTEGKMQPCMYTDSPSRDVFVKSNRDSWQQELRMFWPSSLAEFNAHIPVGSAKLYWLR